MLRITVFSIAILLAPFAIAEDLEIVVNADASPYSARDTALVIQSAAAALSAATGHNIAVVPLHSGAGTTQCTLSFFRGFDIDIDIVARARREPVCEVFIRTGANGFTDQEDLRCIAMHEIGHLLAPGWHSERRESFMFETRTDRRNPAPCWITEDFIAVAAVKEFETASN